MTTKGTSVPAGFSPSGLCALSETFQARLARRELRRYWYVRTGQLLPDADDADRPGVIVLGLADAPSPGFEQEAAAARALGPESAVIRTRKDDHATRLVIMGADPAGLLYGAYRLCEHWGVYFHLHGDSLPDAPLNACPLVDEDHQPLFATRGLHPFHNFPEGPDGWSTPAYRQ
ncbi:MAG: alpha-glucuronidase family glycosyl hydrolase, partial [Kiritimatiellia bacterium]